MAKGTRVYIRVYIRRAAVAETTRGAARSFRTKIEVDGGHDGYRAEIGQSADTNTIRCFHLESRIESEQIFFLDPSLEMKFP